MNIKHVFANFITFPHMKICGHKHGCTRSSFAPTCWRRSGICNNHESRWLPPPPRLGSSCPRLVVAVRFSRTGRRGGVGGTLYDCGGKYATHNTSFIDVEARGWHPICCCTHRPRSTHKHTRDTETQRNTRYTYKRGFLQHWQGQREGEDKAAAAERQSSGSTTLLTNTCFEKTRTTTGHSTKTNYKKTVTVIHQTFIIIINNNK